MEGGKTGERRVPGGVIAVILIAHENDKKTQEAGPIVFASAVIGR